ncbi:MAG TPA: DUF4870 domain-containing protein [Gemmatimonadota bacterium]|nr:DUF4870 domain-containing protein [Gemmatimonadota bacterium]
MNEQNVPKPPPPPGQRPPTASQSSTGLDPKLAGLLCYILGIVTGLIFFLIEKSNDVVRFHAAQSILFSGSMIVLWIVLTILSFVIAQISLSLATIFSLLTMLLGLAVFVLWVVLLIKGYSGQKWKLPVIGDMAERMAGGQRVG